MRKFAKDKLEVTGIDSHPFSACHRLSSEKEAGIIIKFTDLCHRNLWLTSVKNLKGTNCKVSLSEISEILLCTWGSYNILA